MLWVGHAYKRLSLKMQGSRAYFKEQYKIHNLTFGLLNILPLQDFEFCVEDSCVVLVLCDDNCNEGLKIL